MLIPLLINFQELKLLKFGKSTKGFYPFGNLAKMKSVTEVTKILEAMGEDSIPFKFC